MVELPAPECRRYAVVIVGGGVAGCATALALADRGMTDSIVVDALSQPRWHMGEAIPPAGHQILRRLCLWDAFLAQAPLPSAGSCASWGGSDLGYNDFLLDGQGKGWHIDRAGFDAMLAAAVAVRGGTILRGARLREIARLEAGGYELSFDDEAGQRSRIAADFLVDATGVAAAAARRLQVARNQLDCLAVIGGVFELGEPDAVPSQALLEACGEGWWYAAKLPKHRLIAALAVGPEARQRYGETGAWLAALRETGHVARWLDRGRAALVEGTSPETALAPCAILSRVVGDRWLAVGDAASVYDPVLAQGIVKALSDGEAAATAIAACFAERSEAPLLAYQDGVFARFRDALRLRQHLYRLERRWPEAPFWRNRLGGP